MKPNQKVRHLAIWIGLLLTAAQPCLAAAKPNVVLIVADDMGYADLGAFGCKEFQTPNLDRLAAGGTLFSNAYVSAPVCVPSRMGILTGRYQQRWGIYRNSDGHAPHGLKGTAQEYTFAELFQKAGYATALIGPSMAKKGTSPAE